MALPAAGRRQSRRRLKLPLRLLCLIFARLGGWPALISYAVIIMEYACRAETPRWPAIELAPAAERGEHWWPVALAIIAVVGLHVVLPARYRVQPIWVIRELLAAGRLVVDILTNSKLYANNPAGELAAGGVIWATNVIAFALWY